MSDTPIITALPQLDRLAAELAQQTEIAVDLEADSLHCYREKVCLVQISWADQTVLVDPLALPQLEPLRAVLADPGVTKIFHAGDYDIRSLHRDFGIEIRGLFDTMLASQFCGEEKWGLADLLAKHFGVALDKQFQRADWAQRPLSPGMIHYAAEDTRHLFRLKDLLRAKLVELDRLWWAEEDFRLLEQVRMNDAGGPRFLRFKGAGRLSPRPLAALEELLQWRDGEAQRRDVPLFKVLGNNPLLNIALAAPGTAEDLAKVAEVPPRLAERYGQPLLAAVQRALEMPESELPRYPKPPRQENDPAAEERLKRLKVWRQAKAVAFGLDSGVLINNNALELIARQRPTSMAALELLPVKQWQRQVLGPEMLVAIA